MYFLLICLLSVGHPAPSIRLAAQHTFTGEVRGIAVCGKRVWAATGGGLVVHRRTDGKHLFKLTSADGLPGNSLKTIACLDRDRILVGGEFGAAVVSANRKGKPRVRTVDGLSRPDTYSPVFSLLRLDDGSLILVALQRGLVRLVHDASTESWKVEDPPAGPAWWHAAACNSKTCVLGDLAGTVALLARSELFRETDLTDPTRRLILEGAVLALEPLGDRFAAATGEGLFLIEDNKLRPLLYGHDRVRATTLAPGSDKTLLVGTADGIVFRLRDARLTPVARTRKGSITALAQDGKRLWLGIGRAGLHLVLAGAQRPGKSLKTKNEICDNHVTRLTRHRRWLVAGTFDQGACALTKMGWVPLPDLPSPMVLGLASDGRDLYVATSNGIARFGRRLQPRPINKRDARTLRWLATEGATGAAEVAPGLVALTSRFGVVRVWRRKRGRTRIRFTNHDKGAPWKMTGLSSAGGELFAASETQGVKRLGLGQLPGWHLQDPRPLTENWVTAIDAVGADEVWVALCQRGAVHVSGKKSKRFGKAQGLPDERLTAIAATGQGAFLGTLNGIAWASATTGSVRAFGLQHGIPDPRSASLMLEADSLWVGTEAGLGEFKVRT